MRWVAPLRGLVGFEGIKARYCKLSGKSSCAGREKRVGGLCSRLIMRSTGTSPVGAGQIDGVGFHQIDLRQFWSDFDVEIEFWFHWDRMEREGWPEALVLVTPDSGCGNELQQLRFGRGLKFIWELSIGNF